MKTVLIFFRYTLVILFCLLTRYAPAQQVMAWGDNSAGQLNSNTLSGLVAVALGDNHTISLDANGLVNGWGDNSLSQINIPTMLPAKAVAASGNFSLALQQNGLVVAWGDASLPVVQGIPASLQNVIAVAAGQTFGAALIDNGAVRTWGDAAMTPPAGLIDVKAIAAGARHILALRADGSVVAWGDNSKGQCNIPAGLTNVQAIAAGKNHSIALLANGTAVAWGDNTSGQTNTSAINQVKAIACGADHSLYLRADGSVVARGDNAAGQATVPAGVTNVIAIGGGARHSVALSGAGRKVALWGNNSQGQSTSPAVNDHIIQVAAGTRHNVLLRDDGTVFCWGANEAGQLNPPPGLSNVKSVAAGPSYSIALKGDGTVVEWGAFGTRTLPFTDVIAVRDAEGAISILHANGTISLDNHGPAIYTGIAAQVKTLRTGPGSAALYVVRANGAMSSWYWQVPLAVTSPRPVSDLGLGQGNRVLIFADGTAAYSTAAAPTNPAGVVEANGGKFHTLVRTADGNIIAFGGNPYGQVNVPAGLHGVVQVSAGLQHSIALYVVPTTQSNAPPSFTKGAHIVVDENSGPKSFTAWATRISPGPFEPAQTVSFTTSGYNATLFSVPPAVDAFGTLTFTPAPEQNGVTTVTVVATDNGVPSRQSVSQQFTITINPVNGPPTFTSAGDIHVPEDISLFSTVWATNISPGLNEAGQQVSFVVSGYDASLFSTPPTIDANGLLTLAPAHNVNGTTSLTIVAKDNAGGNDSSAPLTVALTIEPINDPPFMNAVNDVAVDAGKTPQKILLTGISPGPPNESAQTIAITATANEPLLGNITVTKTSATEASLEFTTQRNASYSGTITITLNDNGGTAHGGIDETVYTFMIHVNETAGGLFVPTVFSPNNDGVNDVFRIRGHLIQAVELTVYEQGGRRIFYTNNVQEATELGWNGTFGGNTLPPGTYTWALRGTYQDGTAMSFEGKQYGQVLLLR